VSREDVRFASGGETLAGWLYRPDGADGEAPCVVLAHGFGALKEGRLDAYAERFSGAGMAALVFDYRHFGGSTGEPRNLIDVKRQHADWRAAIAHARGLEGVDADRIALWGSSFSGGHVIEVGAGDPGVAAIVAQVPHINGLATLRSAGPRNALRLTVAGLRDAARAARGRPPYYAPIVGPPGTLAAMNSPDALPGYSAMYPEGFDWRNEYAARIGLTLANYSPGRRAADVACPLLVAVGTRDVVTPPEPARKAARRAPKGELKEYDAGHFDVYRGDAFERGIGDQLDFLARAVG
jgi:fermentation-respiration switch protein FrsA (DUF1100 family)